MKKLFSLFIGLASLAYSYAQSTEGTIKYSIEFSSSDPQVQAQLSMLGGSTMTQYFTPNFSRIQTNMGMFMNNSTVIDLKSKESVMLMEGMMGKKAVKGNIDELGKSEEDGDEPKIEVEKTGKTKKIAGFKCSQYVLTTEEGATMNYWTTTELTAAKTGNKFMNDKVEGFPLAFELSTNGLLMKFTATEVLKEIKGDKASLFSLSIPDGYEEVSIDDLKSMGM
ncbi:MAG: DUF4412 domain-containing protein [Crocinitomicaceae bacterium]|nr:DUF4412 domain-containing protein [Crocinitomicaceae bacterium]